MEPGARARAGAYNLRVLLLTARMGPGARAGADKEAGAKAEAETNAQQEPGTGAKVEV